ncbi:response regulator [Undibacterium griseum]|uniref:histidine kinase n=1 Tax=Undibacterium griseum TaxID=2762295 RepID=A0ABR6YM06_9BURK|nr:response regulator [Undibacterium griseum]MBC3884815.1 response regulator [Undibacterium griseum]
MGNDFELSDAQMRESCFAAFDLMRDSPEEGRIIASRLRQSAVSHRLPVMGTFAELLFAFADFFDGRLAQAEPEFERISVMFELVGDKEGLAFSMLGTVAVWRRHGMSEQAYSLCHTKILPLLPEGDHRLSVLIFNLLGILSQELGFTEEGIRHFYMALEQAQRLNILNRVSQVMANLGEIFYISGNAEDAEPLLQEARAIAIQSNERWLAPFISTMYALCKIALDKYEEAYLGIVDYIGENSQAHYPDAASRAFCFSIAAYTLAMRGQLEEADRLNAIAQNLSDSYEDKPLKPYTRWVSGHLHWRHKRFPEAIHDLRRAIDENGIQGYIYIPLRAIRELIDIFAELGQWEEGFKEQQRYLELFAKAQGQATRVHVQTLRIKNELKQAELARRLAEDAMAERRALDVELKRMLSERETILENSIVGMVFLNNQGRVQWANTPLCQIFRVDRGQILGASLEPYYPSRTSYLESGEAVSAAVLRGESFEAELQMRRADGDLFWAHFSGRAVDQNDLSHGTVWVVMDISARRQLEADLNRSEKHYRQLVNHASEGIMVVQNQKIVFANPQIYKLTAREPDSLLAHNFADLIFEGDRLAVQDYDLRCLRGEMVAPHFQCRMLNPAVEKMSWVELSSVLIDWEGQPANLSFISDVTERKCLELQLQQSMAEQMRLQTIQMQNELKEAERARRHAEESTEAKSIFLANMSHEIRTPMNAIIGMAHLALRTELSPKQKDYLEKIHQAGLSLMGVINDILDFSKVEAGKLHIENTVFNLDEVLENVCAITADKAYEKGLELIFDVPQQIPRALCGDALRLGQILINLINNAVKFTQHGEVYVRCRHQVVSEGQLQLQFEIRDTGIGMTPEQMQRLFQPFSQADESTTRKFGGTGLGLSISRRVVELMGGQINLESESGLGTCVRFYLGFGLSPDVRTPAHTELIRHKRILIVDDNALAANVLRDELELLGARVDVAQEAAPAIQMMQIVDNDDPYDLVFVDLNMPAMDGLTWIDTLKRGQLLETMPAFVLMGMHGREEASHRADVMMPDAFLPKPVRFIQVLDCITALYSKPLEKPGHKQAIRVPQYAGLRVLLAEDNQMNQQIACELMEAGGIQVDVAENGEAALEMLLQEHPDYYGMVFMDVQMPVLDGHDATRMIRSRPAYEGLPIVAMTAHAMLDEIARCKESGMSAHLAKPITPAALYDMISHWCPQFITENTVLTAEDVAGNHVLSIEMVDVDEGLQRTLGNADLYMELLRRFCDDQHDAVAKAVQMHQAGDQEQAERLIHTLKGVAALIAATTVRQEADVLEQYLRAREYGLHVDRQFQLCDLQLQKTRASIQVFLGKQFRDTVTQDATGSPQVYQRQILLSTLRQCEQLLSEYDGEAVDFLVESSDVIVQALGAELHKQIMRAAKQFDFDLALNYLRQGIAQHGLSEATVRHT